MTSDFPALTALAQTYLHQDFGVVSGGAAAAVEEFLRDDPDLAALIPAEVERALASCDSEKAARSFVISSLGSYYKADGGGSTYRGWLQSVADRASELGYS